MAPQVVMTRKRSFKEAPGCGFFCTGEILFEVYNLVIAVAQLVACFGFFPDAGKIGNANFYDVACWIFAVTCFLGGISSSRSILEIRSQWKPGKMTDDEKSVNRRERLESWMYAVGMFAFTIGAILFLPEVYEHSERNDLTAGTAMFVFGSTLFWFATFINSLSLNVHHLKLFNTNERITVYGTVSLGFSQFGSIAFVAGSIFYFPEAPCEECEWKSIYIGTYLYVIGAAFFLGAAMCNLALAYAKRIMEAQNQGQEPGVEAANVVDEKSSAEKQI